MNKYLPASDVAGSGLFGIQRFAEGNERIRRENVELRARLVRIERFVEAFLE